MEAALQPESLVDPQSRIRLLALALASMHDHVPVQTSRVRGVRGRGEHRRKATYTRREADALILRLGVEERDVQLSPADRFAVSRHPFWGQLGRALELLRVYDGFGWRMVMHVLVEPQDSRRAAARLHALPFLAGGDVCAVEAPRAALVRALVRLDELLPDVAFPREVLEQVEGWNEWLAALRSRALGEKATRSADYRRALRLRDAYVVELFHGAGWSGRRIARSLGIDEAQVRRALKREESDGGSLWKQTHEAT